MKVLVTSSKGQLGRTIQSLEFKYPSDELDITKKSALRGFFKKQTQYLYKLCCLHQC